MKKKDKAQKLLKMLTVAQIKELTRCFEESEQSTEKLKQKLKQIERKEEERR